MDINTKDCKRILVAPLNWGLGHATRSMALIDRFIEEGKEVAIASDGLALDLLKKEYPKLKSFSISPYNIHYKGNFFINLSLQIPKILKAIRREKKEAFNIIKDWRPDLIISDNRYGFSNKEVDSVIITHQLKPYFKNPIVSRSCELLVTRLLKDFDEIWVPDDEKRSLSGSLSMSNDPRVRFIGALSRITIPEQSVKTTDLLVVLSGPEPARTKLENLLLELLTSGLNTIFIRGTNNSMSFDKSIDGFELIDLANSRTIAHHLSKTKILICRSGYSSLMDIIDLKAHKIIIPTPGQTEQEYLARRLDGKMGFIALEEKELLVKLPQLLDQLNN